MRWLLPPVLWALLLVAMAIQKIWLPLMPALPAPLHLVGILPLGAGFAVTVAAARHFRRVKTNIRPFRKPDRLVVDGLYAFTRNPMYLGLALMLLGAAVLFNDLFSFVFPVIFLLVANGWYINFEERAAAEQFGEAYEEYRRRVRRWI